MSDHASSQRTLVNIFADILVYICETSNDFRESPNKESSEEVRGTLLRKLEEAKKANFQETGSVGEKLDKLYSDQYFDLASFAVVAFCDERLVDSNWAERNAWAKNPLQKELHGSVMAGSVFFDNIQDVRDILSNEERDTYELYYTCLTLGFEGRMYDSPEQLLELKRSMHDRLVRYDKAHRPAELRLPEERNLTIKEFSLNRALFGFLLGCTVFVVLGVWYVARLNALSEATSQVLSIYAEKALQPNEPAKDQKKQQNKSS